MEFRQWNLQLIMQKCTNWIIRNTISSAMNVLPVRSQEDLRRFIDLPYRIYRHDPNWVPPLRDEQRGQFDPRRNPMLEHCERELFLLKDGGAVLGRIAAFVDTLAVDFWKERIGLFGYFECGPDLCKHRQGAGRTR